MRNEAHSIHLSCHHIPLPCILALLVLSALSGCASPAGATPTRPQFATSASRSAATLDVATNPSGATILLDGAAYGRTPQTIVIEPGQHKLQLTLDGYAPTEMMIVGVAGQKTNLLEKLIDNVPPVVQLNLPAAVVGPQDGLKVTATAHDASGIASMALFVDGTQRTESHETSMRHNVDTRALSAGLHEIIVDALDRSGNRQRALARFEILAPTADPAIAPTAAPPSTITPTNTVAREPSPPPTEAVRAQPQPTAAPPTPVTPVSVAWGEIRIATYDYQRALYSDPGDAGHPYPLLHRDQIGPPREVTYRTLMMRNEYVELTLLPELGGRIYQVRYLPTGQNLLYNNAVIKATHWGPEDQGWWLAVGGIEFCLPVNEHGYLTAEPWEATVVQHDDGSATAAMHILERSRHLDARVEITLRPGDTRLGLRSTITSRSDRPESFQYWINAMLSPGSPGIKPSLRFYYPASEVIVHSRGDKALPDAGERMSWPHYNGHDLSHYATWHDWLGFFAPDVREPWMGLYDPEAAIGIVRVFPTEVARGVKLFGFGLEFGDTGAYTDDNTQYVEMWGGLTPTFWDDAIIAPGEHVSWSETWYPLAGCHGISTANAAGTLFARRVGDHIEVSIAVPAQTRGTLRVLADSGEPIERIFYISPAAPYTVHVPLVGNPAGPITVQVVDTRGTVRLSYRL